MITRPEVRAYAGSRHTGAGVKIEFLKFRLGQVVRGNFCYGVRLPQLSFSRRKGMKGFLGCRADLEDLGYYL